MYVKLTFRKIEVVHLDTQVHFFAEEDTREPLKKFSMPIVVTVAQQDSADAMISEALKRLGEFGEGLVQASRRKPA